MNRKLVSLWTVITLQCFATYAGAACSWVLWADDQNFSNPVSKGWGSHTTEWVIVNASTSESECLTKMEETRMRLMKSLVSLSEEEDVMVKSEGDTISIAYFPKNAKATETIKRSQTIRYICLPDTVDPRHSR